MSESIRNQLPPHQAEELNKKIAEQIAKSWEAMQKAESVEPAARRAIFKSQCAILGYEVVFDIDGNPIPPRI